MPPGSPLVHLADRENENLHFSDLITCTTCKQLQVCLFLLLYVCRFCLSISVTNSVSYDYRRHFHFCISEQYILPFQSFCLSGCSIGILCTSSTASLLIVLLHQSHFCCLFNNILQLYPRSLHWPCVPSGARYTSSAMPSLVIAPFNLQVGGCVQMYWHHTCLITVLFVFCLKHGGVKIC